MILELLVTLEETLHDFFCHEEPFFEIVLFYCLVLNQLYLAVGEEVALCLRDGLERARLRLGREEPIRLSLVLLKLSRFTLVRILHLLQV